MSRNGTGTYSLPTGNPVVTGTTISSTWANNTLTDIATALTGSLAADGQTTATGNLKMGSNRVTGLADGIAATDAATVNQIPSGALFLLKASNLSDVADATTSRGNLVAAKSGANSDITSLTGLTTPLTVAQGGTGAATLTANNVLLGNGTSALQVVAPSTSGNILTSNGTTWVSSKLPAGSTLQVVQTFFTTSFTTSSNSMTDLTGMSLSITPKSATSKILLITSMSTSKSTSGSGIAFQWVRNGTAVGIGTLGTTAPNYSFGYTQAGSNTINNVNFSYLDAPATASAITYKLQVRVESAGGTFALNNNPSYLNVGTDVYHAGYTSTITAIEVSA